MYWLRALLLLGPENAARRLFVMADSAGTP
jgi:hypothetical protein